MSLTNQWRFMKMRRYRGGIVVSIFIYCNPPNALLSKKNHYPPAGYFGYEYELSVHLNISHNSLALVRVLRAGAFCFFQFLFERSNKEPSPERVRSERGREDKPLTPVLYSTREGGELYGAIFFRQGKNPANTLLQSRLMAIWKTPTTKRSGLLTRKPQPLCSRFSHCAFPAWDRHKYAIG